MPQAVDRPVGELVPGRADVNGGPEKYVHNLGIALCGNVEKPRGRGRCEVSGLKFLAVKSRKDSLRCLCFGFFGDALRETIWGFHPQSPDKG